MRRRVLFAALLGLVAVPAMALALGAGCTSPPEGAGGAAAGGPGSGGLGGDAGEDAGTDAKKDAEPEGDAGWVPVSWEAPCPVQVALHPEKAIAKLEWVPCEDGSPGCEMATITEPGSALRLNLPFFAPAGEGYRMAVDVRVPGSSDYRTVVYESDGTPLAVWRFWSGNCLMGCAGWGDGKIWFSLLDTSELEGTSAYFVADATDTIGIPKLLPIQGSPQGYAANDTTLAVWEFGGSRLTIYDRLSNTAKSFGPTPAHTLAHPVGDSAFLLVYPGFNQPEGWIWNRSTHTTEPLVQVLPEVVPDIKSDGNTIIWLRHPPLDASTYTYPAGELWTSPFATSKAGLKPEKRRVTVPVGEVTSAANLGYYAFNGSTMDRKIHLYRLSDGHHWEFVPPQSASTVRTVAYVDTEYLFYRTAAGVYRQALDALGPGDPAP